MARMRGDTLRHAGILPLVSRLLSHIDFSSNGRTYPVRTFLVCGLSVAGRDMHGIVFCCMYVCRMYVCTVASAAAGALTRARRYLSRMIDRRRSALTLALTFAAACVKCLTP